MVESVSLVMILETMLKLINMTMKRSNVMMNCKRKSSYQSKNLHYEKFIKFDKYFEVIKKMGIDVFMARKLLFHNQYIFNVPEKHLMKMSNLCKRWHINMETLPKNPKFLTLPFDVVEHRIMVLLEMGVRDIHAELLSCYITVLSMRMSLFKAVAKIPESVNMADKFIECLGPLPPDVPPLGPLGDNLSVHHYRAQCWEWYLNWRLNLSQDDKINMDKVMPAMKRRSFRVMKKQIDFLHDVIGLTGEKILKRACLSKGSAEDLEKIINAVKTFGGIEMERLIRKKPKLHRMEYDNVMQVIKLLEEYKVTNKMTRLFPNVLVMPHQTVKERIDIIENTPEFRVLKNNPRVLLLVQSMKVARVRLEYLRYHNVNSATIRVLTASRTMFEKIMNTGVDRTNGREIGFSLAKMLNLDAKEICRRIKKHPYWRSIGIVSMNDTGKYLLEHFSREDVRENVLLILYSKDKIAEALKRLPEMSEESQEKKLYSGRDILATCLYEMEREYHFSGDGIWRLKTPVRQPRILTEDLEVELSEVSDSENAEVVERVEMSRKTKFEEKNVCQ